MYSTIRKNVRPDRLHPSAENGALYNSRGPDDPDQRGLIESIRQNGIQAPLLVSKDWFVVSGHSRLAAAQHLQMKTVPVEILPIRRTDFTSDEWVKILREHNHGRTKTFDELVREKLVDVSDECVLRAAQESRAMRKHGTAAEIRLSVSRKTRHNISDIKRPFACAVVRVLNDLGEDKPVSVRSVHYQLLRDPPRRNSKDPGSIYANDKNSYKDLSDLLTRMRLAEMVPWGWISDDIRPVRSWRTWSNAGEFIASESKSLFDGYCRDLMQSQRTHYVVVVEKATVRSFLEDTCFQYRIPLVVSRGNSSIDMRFQLAEQFRRSGKDRIHLFVLGDADPDGDSIVHSLCQSLRDEFDLEDLTADRVGITHQQADELKLPRSLEAKISSKNYGAFVKRHGRSDCYELEAVGPAQLRKWLDEAIRSRIDMAAYNHEVVEQQQELRGIIAKKRAVLDLMAQNPDMSGSSGDDE